MSQHKIAMLEKRVMAHIAKQYTDQPLSKNWTHKCGIPLTELRNGQEDPRNVGHKRLFEILSKLPHYGIGRIVVKHNQKIQDAPSYWRVTGVQVDHTAESLDYGVAYGVFTQAGYNTGYQTEITRMNEKYWLLVPKYMESKYTSYVPVEQPTHELPLYVKYPPLMERMLQAKQIKEGVAPSEVETPMVRLLVKREPFGTARQRLEDGTLV